MNPMALLEKLRTTDARYHKSLLASYAGSYGGDQYLDLLHEIRKISDHSECTALLDLVAECIRPRDYSHVAISELMQLILELCLGTPWDGRFIYLNKYFECVSQDFYNILDFSCNVYANGSKLSPNEEALIASALFDTASTKCHELCTHITKLRALHQGQKGVTDYLTRLRENLGILRLDEITGPLLRQQYYREIVLAGKIDDHMLIVGPSGCGKSTIAEILYTNGKHKAGGKLYSYKCDFIDERKRLMTDVRKNVIPTSATILIDEIHKLTPKKQEDLVNVFQSNNVRVLSASSMDFVYADKMFHDFRGRYCQNKFAILDLKLRVPDLEAAIQKEASNRHLDIDQDVVLRMVGHDWKDNYREVKSVMNDICSVINRARETAITREGLARHLADFSPGSKAFEIVKSLL